MDNDYVIKDDLYIKITKRRHLNGLIFSKKLFHLTDYLNNRINQLIIKAIWFNNVLAMLNLRTFYQILQIK